MSLVTNSLHIISLSLIIIACRVVASLTRCNGPIRLDCNAYYGLMPLTPLVLPQDNFLVISIQLHVFMIILTLYLSQTLLVF